MEYKKTVQKIINRPWKNLSKSELEKVVYLSHVAAIEFAESLRIALELHPADLGLQEMAEGELDTDNLAFDDYQSIGDHAAFLGYFIEKNRIRTRMDEPVFESQQRYLEDVRKLSKEVRAMSIFSREEELANVFEKMLKNPAIYEDDMLPFEYYFRTHIELDMQEGGHAELLSSHAIDDRVDAFYQGRNRLYDCIDFNIVG